MPFMKLKEIVAAVGGDLEGDGDLEIRGVSGLRDAQSGDLTFFADARYADSLLQTAASAVLMARNGHRAPAGKSIVYCENPYASFLQLLRRFSPQESFPEGIHPTAIIGRGAKIGAGVSIGALVVVEDNVEIGDRVVLRPGTFIGSDTRIGAETFVFPNVTIREGTTIGTSVIVHSGTVIGSDGFGFVRDGARHVKVPQLGTVEIGDDVEIGANCAIDRGTSGVTRIGRGSKLDNLVHVGHNVTVGEHTLLIAQVGIGGSTEIGNRATLAGQVGVVGHIKIGDDAAIGAQSGVTKSVPARGRWSGYPARPHAENLRAQASLQRLAGLEARIRALEEELSRAKHGDSKS
ncbi:MAG: UDP-3-O-(3-hydroxymyristoyl)glucosamine N-acyltransferase [bacterium]